jgi:hypothetical protein
MASLNFVAVEDGLEENPKVKTLSRLIHVPRSMAVWFIVRLRRMILDHGNHITGVLPKRFNEEDVASFLEFDGKATILIASLKRQGFLRRKSGLGFIYPDWQNTITGRYACQRERDRLWHEKDRSNRRSDDVGRRSSDTPNDSRTTSDDIQTGRKEGRESGRPPVPPPKGGQALGASRWEWLLENAPTPQNREVCMRYLSEMSPQDWALVQYAYMCRQGKGGNTSKKNSRTLDWPTDIFLRKTVFLRFTGSQRTFKNALKVDQGKTPIKPKEEAEENRAQNEWQWLEGYLADPMWPDTEKEQRRVQFEQKWKCKPWAGDAPWIKKTKSTKKGDKK